MPQDDDSTPASNAQTYLEVASKLLALAAEAKSAEAREQFVALAALYQNLALSSQAMDWAPRPPPIPAVSGVAQSSWQGSYLHYRRETILAHAPRVPGVYALWSASCWVYVGESVDLRSRLLAHLEGADECILRQGARGFGFEFIDDPQQRASRLQALLRELLPLCNSLPG